MSTQYDVVHYKFIHNVMGSFFRGIASYLGNELFEDTTEVIIGTYEKSLQHFKNMLVDESNERHDVRYPYLSLDPRLDFEPDDIAGKFLYQYPHYSTAQAAHQFGPDIYRDSNVLISPMINRYKGSFEVTIWCRSVYEYIDLRMLTYQFFGGGFGRVIYPQNIQGYMTIPENFRDWETHNPYDETTSQLNWDDNKAESVLFRAINQEKFVFPFSFTPWLTLTGASDASEKYGGDDLTEYKLSLDISWESYIPTHVILVDSVGPGGDIATCNIGSGVTYTNPTGEVAHTEMMTIQANMNTGEKTTRDMIVKKYDNAHLTYIITQDDIDIIDEYNYPDVNERVSFSLPEPIIDVDALKIFHASGELQSGYQFDLQSDKQTIDLIPVDLKSKFNVDDLLTIIVYEQEPE